MDGAHLWFQVFQLLLRSFHRAHSLILKEEALLTTLTACAVLPLLPESDSEAAKFVACVCNVGDSLAYVYSPSEGHVREITQVSKLSIITKSPLVKDKLEEMDVSFALSSTFLRGPSFSKIHSMAGQISKPWVLDERYCLSTADTFWFNIALSKYSSFWKKVFFFQMFSMEHNL